MSAHSILRPAAALVALATIPFAWVLGMTDLPTMNEVVAAKTADTIGVWLFTWSLIVVASIAAVGVAWACWSWDREAAGEADWRKADKPGRAVQRGTAGVP